MGETRSQIERWLSAAIESVNPVELTRQALVGPPATVIAIGKAAAGMCRGAAEALDAVTGICVTDVDDSVPEGIELLVGDHPIPGMASLEAGRRAIATVQSAPGRIVALISGGGSALCEMPRAGIDFPFIQQTNRLLLRSGASIEEANLVRGHLSAIKCGGLSRAAGRPIETLVISDVAGAGPEVVASGPTFAMKFEPDRARQTMEEYGVTVPDRIWEAMSRPPDRPSETTVEVLADGKSAAEAAASAARSDRYEASVSRQWISGPLATRLDRFLDGPKQGVSIAVGEATLEVTGEGSGGRNSHAALLAATRIVGTGSVFAGFATDGVDGPSDSAGAIVDGSTILRGGDPAESLANFDSANYLQETGDLLPTRTTGTNVGDLWLIHNE